jgi:hypothetical protein
MSFFNRVKHTNFYIKLTNWEYWPFGIVQGPFFLYWLWYSIKTRSLFFFSASNPSILTGGMFGESKFDVLRLVPDELKPKGILVKFPVTRNTVIKLIEENGFSLPVIFKPDLGERGWMVKRIKQEQDIDDYLSQIKVDFIIQELVDLPLEFGVFYVRIPNEERGNVTSITGKEFLSITGDGTATLQQLILRQDRARLQWDALRKQYYGRANEIIAKGEKMELVSIGNHCLGTKFLNANHFITPELNTSFDRIGKRIDHFYFGRFDLRCSSIEDLQKGNVKILELNGCGAEPAHIYHPGASLKEALKVLHRHWKNLYQISAINHSRGAAYLSFREGREIFKRFRALKTE